MEIGLAILLFVCMTALLYVVLSLKISRQVDLQIKEFYKTRIHADMQEFYREMEGYAALFENRIQRFRVLVERNESVVREADLNQENADAQAAEELRVQAAELEAAIAAAPRRSRDKKNKTKPVAKSKPAPVVKGKPVKTKPEIFKKAAAVSTPIKPQPQLNRVRTELPSAPPRSAAAPETTAPVPHIYSEADDSAIAEELMKDLFLKDEVELTRNNSPKAAPAVTVRNAAQGVPEERPESPGMASFFSRLGKAIEPVIFGEKAVSEAVSEKTAKTPLSRTAPEAVAQKNAPDFGEVLRRAEQIKAEKKAERERAEVEARAEFYAAGDSLTAGATAPRSDRNADIDARIRNAIAAENAAARVNPAPERRVAAAAPEMPARNALVVKELDRHTVNFLIDSLVKDNGYRKQALRALTENNIPLDEIARLSKIDIGELELMRQLGRF